MRFPALLDFQVGDMRELAQLFPQGGGFGAVVNLFTSFGYFDSQEDNLRVLQGVHHVLKPDGIFCLDYLNAERVRLNPGLAQEKRELEGVEFELTRAIWGSRVEKDIVVRDGVQRLNFQESVQLLTLADFEPLFEQAGLKLDAVWGDYHGAAYSPAMSPRLVLLATKA